MLACSLIGGSIGRESALAAKHPKLHHLNWNLLRTFLVIAEERSITGAANRLKMQQPTITAALKRLEETLDCQLVLRSSRQFSLTKRGELLQKECVEILRMVTRKIGRASCRERV